MEKSTLRKVRTAGSQAKVISRTEPQTIGLIIQFMISVATILIIALAAMIPW